MIRGAIKIAIMAVILYKVAETLFRFGAFFHYQKHHPGDCRQVKGLNFGSEDFQVASDGLAFISSGLWFPTATALMEYSKENNVQGSIYLYDFNKPDLGAVKLKLTPSKDFNPETFHPHGISLLEDEIKGEHLLYVINHPEDRDDAIEKFRFLPKTRELIHVKSFTGDKLQMTNDLAMIEEDKFYITNCLYFRNHILSILEQFFLPFHLGSLVFFNGTDFTIVESNLHAPNGLYLSKDKRYLYMNLPLSSKITAYEIKDDKSVIQLQSVTLYSAADNLHLSQSGDVLYTGAHPILYKAYQYFQDPRQYAPSSVLRLPLKDGKIDAENISELFYDHGDLISGSSVATVYNSKLLIGSIFHKLVICDVNINM